MKKLVLLLSVLVLISCKKEIKDYATVSGKILNPHESQTLRIFDDKGFEKMITINEDGTFSDTLKVEDKNYTIKHGDEYGSIYLKNGFESSFTTDYEDFDNNLIYKGDGSDANNFQIQSYLITEDYFSEDLFANPTEERLNTAIEDYKNGFKTLQETYTLDSLHTANAEKSMNNTIKSYNNYLQGKIALLKELPKGTKSPTFVNYINHKGGTTSLSDLKGKYVYVDVWATWCGPCKREIPSLKEVEKKYHDKNIEFVSISVDAPNRHSNDADKAYNAWNKMVTEKELGGIQLFSDKDWKSDFITAYKIQGIPRFILIDPKGNIVTPDAPRPSSSKLIELFEELNI